MGLYPERGFFLVRLAVFIRGEITIVVEGFLIPFQYDCEKIKSNIFDQIINRLYRPTTGPKIID